MINKDNYLKFTYTNEELLKNPPKGIVMEFHGLGGGLKLTTEHYPLAHFFAEQDIIYAMPCTGPWSWMNRAAVNMADGICEALFEKYGMTLPTASTGYSMGGLAGLIYARYSKYTPKLCAVLCPVCDLPYHYTEREDTARSIYSALGGYEISLEEAMTERSPIHQAQSMPKIPYLLFVMGNDTEVNYTRHSMAFIEKMKGLGHDIDHVFLPEHGHCGMTDAAIAQYREFIAQKLLI